MFKLLVLLLQKVLQHSTRSYLKTAQQQLQNYLSGRGVIVDEATGKGVQGVTSNRLAVVYVK